MEDFMSQILERFRTNCADVLLSDLEYATSEQDDFGGLSIQISFSEPCDPLEAEIIALFVENNGGRADYYDQYRNVIVGDMGSFSHPEMIGRFAEALGNIEPKLPDDSLLFKYGEFVNLGIPPRDNGLVASQTKALDSSNPSVQQEASSESARGVDHTKHHQAALLEALEQHTDREQVNRVITALHNFTFRESPEGRDVLEGLYQIVAKYPEAVNVLDNIRDKLIEAELVNADGSPAPMVREVVAATASRKGAEHIGFRTEWYDPAVRREERMKSLVDNIKLAAFGIYGHQAGITVESNRTSREELDQMTQGQRRAHMEALSDEQIKNLGQRAVLSSDVLEPPSPNNTRATTTKGGDDIVR